MVAHVAVPTVGAAFALLPAPAVPAAASLAVQRGGRPAQDVVQAALATAGGIPSAPRSTMGIEAGVAGARRTLLQVRVAERTGPPLDLLQRVLVLPTGAVPVATVAVPTVAAPGEPPGPGTRAAAAPTLVSIRSSSAVRVGCPAVVIPAVVEQTPRLGAKLASRALVLAAVPAALSAANGSAPAVVRSGAAETHAAGRVAGDGVLPPPVHSWLR